MYEEDDYTRKPIRKMRPEGPEVIPDNDVHWRGENLISIKRAVQQDSGIVSSSFRIYG